MSNDPFNDPGSSTGIKWEALAGRLLIVWPQSEEKGIQTTFGLSDAIKASVVVVDGEGGPVEYRDTLIFPKVLQGNVRSSIGTGRPVLGRLGQGQAKPGQSAPWVLLAASDADKKLGVAYLTSGTPAAAPEPATAASAGNRPW